MWQDISTADSTGRAILVAFNHPNEWIGWVKFVAPSYGDRTNLPGYAKPTHWTELPDDPE